MKLSKTSKMIYISSLVSMALILFTIENMIPVPFITPGAKLGLANLVIMIAIYTLDNYKQAFLVLALRIILSSLLVGNLSTLIYSSVGGILSFFVAILVKELFKDKVSIIGVSASAAVFHNVGQLLVASLILNNFGIFLYLPILSIAGIGTGIFVGISANYLLAHLRKLPYFKN
ncbi:Gx transporter family protein [Clostridium sp.]|uniref:Gx transporter family protein n=1 Tax=Clostridium sp. TaxID=1506 RepID=UPI0026DC1495|nr:Gx transporter family protein [Clostridium sp.]MDO5039103.1 Gx transporter family protein [Clostridium sp.]